MFKLQIQIIIRILEPIFKCRLQNVNIRTQFLNICCITSLNSVESQVNSEFDAQYCLSTFYLFQSISENCQNPKGFKSNKTFVYTTTAPRALPLSNTEIIKHHQLLICKSFIELQKQSKSGGFNFTSQPTIITNIFDNMEFCLTESFVWHKRLKC